MSEWTRYLDAWISHEQTPLSEHEGFARELLNDSIEHNEISHYEAHLIMGAFLSERGYS